MPSALETLVKILKLEREQGGNNTAVIGGISAYARNWEGSARTQARNAEQFVLIDELNDLLLKYEQLENKNDRLATVNYMLERITGRSAPPPQYQAKIADYEVALKRDKPVEKLPDSATAQDQPDQSQTVERPAEAERRERTTADRKAQQERRDRENKATPRTQENAPAHGEKPRPPRDNERREPQSQQNQQNQRTRQNNPPKKPVPARHERSGGEGDVSEAVFETADSFEATFTGQFDIPAAPRLARPPRTERKVLDVEEAVDIMRGLNASVEHVRGVGPRMAQALKKLGISSINDLLFLLPRRYDDYTRMRSISKLMPNIVATVIGTVRRAEIHIGRNARKDFVIDVDDGTGVMTVVFFGQQFLVRQMRPGMQIVLSGMTTSFNGRIRMANPEWEKLDAENLHTVGIVPVYPLTDGLTARSLRRLMKETVDYWSERLPDYVPQATLERAELADLGWMLKNLHFPEGQDHLRHAQNRYIFDQLLLLQMAILANRRDWQAVPGEALDVSDDFLENFIDTIFPYPLTGAQRRSIEDIRRDIARPVPMNRLLQGDVGAGKTAVAITALGMAFQARKQSALMAPTSILAEQHYRNITRAFERLPENQRPVIRLLTGSLTAAERNDVYKGLENADTDIVIGTQALIQGGVEFNNLALAIIDEQHRFGVEQRGALRGKGINPHLLVMTATPIPRTMALTLYADLDLSVMDEMPPGRTPVRTRIVREVERQRVHSFIEAQVKEGRQAFIVHPLVEASDKVEAKSALEAYEQYRKLFHRYQVGLLHGRMRPAEKDQVMGDFSSGKYDILVTTSVAEVGVDVPNATVIVIEGANRFGLAQLHQFRGRVGRGQFVSYCLLIPDMETPEAQERLEALEGTTDGFKLAEIDWKLRGAGDLVGTRQSGRSELQLADVMTPQLVELAQREARTIYEEDPYLERPEHYLLAQRVKMIYQPQSDVS
jgi:ATP-dependent DNA helicase RecG